MTPVARRTAAATVLAVVVLTSTGCGGRDEATSAPAVASSGPTAGDSTPARSASLAPSRFVSTYRAALDRATTADVAITMPGTTSISGVTDFTTKPPALSLDVKGGPSGGETRLIITGGSLYVRPGTERKYFKTSLASLTALSGAADAFDPNATIPLLRKGITSATDLGALTLHNGEQVHGYRAVLDGRALESSSSGRGRRNTSGVPASVPLTVYIDGEGHLRRELISRGRAGTVRIDYTHWGRTVDITAPPARQVQSSPGS